MTPTNHCDQIGHQWEAEITHVDVDVPNGAFIATAPSYIPDLQQQASFSVNLHIACRFCHTSLYPGITFLSRGLKVDPKHKRRLSWNLAQEKGKW